MSNLSSKEPGLVKLTAQSNGVKFIFLQEFELLKGERLRGEFIPTQVPFQTKKSSLIPSPQREVIKKKRQNC